MTDDEDNASWVEHGRFYSPLDNEALAHYFDVLAKLKPEIRARVVSTFEQATRDGWRPRLAVKRALAFGPQG